MVDFVHKGFDYRCCVINFGLQQFPRALTEPDQRVIGQYHVGHQRQPAADDHREQAVLDGRPRRSGVDVE